MKLRHLAASALLLLLLGGALSWALDLPTVYRSSLDGRCVRVETKHGAGSCAALPSRYHNVWVH